MDLFNALVPRAWMQDRSALDGSLLVALVAVPAIG